MTTRFRTPDRSGGKPATNRLSYGAAFFTFTQENIICSKEEVNKYKVVNIFI
jgi:hypothetical protein